MAKKNVAAAIAEPAKKLFRIPPDPEDMNEERAEAAGVALDAFTAYFGETVEGDDLTIQNLSDLIADFGHYCDRNNIDFSKILSMAQYNYDEETDNKGKQEFTI